MNTYTKEDILKLIKMYKDVRGTFGVDDDYNERIRELTSNNYDISKVVRYETWHGSTRDLHIESSIFTFVERHHIFETTYEDLPLLINDEYVLAHEPIALIIKWRLSIGK